MSPAPLRPAWVAAVALWGVVPVQSARPRLAIEPDTLTTAYEVSGLRVIQRMSQANNVVAVRLYLLGGTRQLTDRSAGIEALLLKASEYGTAQFPGEEARRALARTGSVVVLDPDADWTVFGFTGLAQFVDTAWRVFADRLLHPTLSPTAVEQARGKLLAAARRRYTQPDERVHQIAMQALFHDHPYSRDPSGTPETLPGLTLADVRAYARDQVVTSRMLLVVVGNVSRAHVESLVTATLAQLPHGDYRWTLPPAAPQRQPGWLIANGPLPTTYLLAYFAGPPPTSHRYWAFRVATAILSSNLYQAVRVRRSLSYAAYAPYNDWAIPVGGTYVSTTKPDSALPLVLEQLQNVKKRERDAFRLSLFIDALSFDYLSGTASAAGQADFLARAELYLGSYTRAGEFVRQLHRVRPYDVEVAATEYFAHMQFAYLGDSTRMHGHW